MTRHQKELFLLAKREKKIRLCRDNFWTFCKTVDTNKKKVYTDDKLYLKEICDRLQDLYEGKLLKPDGTPYKKLQLNCPPGFAKSYTMILFAEWCFGKDKNNEVITVSYNEKLTSKFGTAVRDGIEQERDASKLEISYKDIFPNIKIKYGDASRRDWALEGRHHSYLATSFRGTLTGMRGNIGIIDDPVKSAEEACNEDRLEENWLWYTDTFLSRLVEGAIQIVVQTRWSTKDLCGKLIEHEPDDWYVLKYEIYDEETDTMLCPALMSKATYDDKKSKTSIDIFMANYHQRCIDIKGRLYTSLREYDTLPEKVEKIIAVVDTADTGKDKLAMIIAALYKGQAYILDMYYTADPMEITEPEVAKRLFEYKVDTAIIESNNGGRGFARNVERLLWSNHKSRQTRVRWFHQSFNKVARILSNATNVMNNIFFPINWKHKYRDAYDHITAYQRQGKNKSDDIEDVLTMLSEELTKPRAMSTDKRLNV